MALHDTFGLVSLKLQMRSEIGESLYARIGPANRVTLGIGRDATAGISRTESHFLWLNDVTDTADALDRAAPAWRTLPQTHQRTILGLATGSPSLGMAGTLTVVHLLIAGQPDAAWSALAAHSWAGDRPRHAAAAIARMKNPG